MKILRQVVKFGKAHAIWLLNGKPVRSESLMLHIFKTHCQPCVHYDPELKECSVCECPVSEKRDERNKLFYATEQCPLPQPRFTRDFDGEAGEGMGDSTRSSNQPQQEHREDSSDSNDSGGEV